MKPPNLIVCDSFGNAVEVPELRMAGAANGQYQCPDDESLVALPESGVLLTLPGRVPVGCDPVTGMFVEVREYGGSPVTASAAFLPPGYVQTLTSAYIEPARASRLPLYSYSAVGWLGGRFYAAGHRIDRRRRHEIPDCKLPEIDAKAHATLRRHPRNRLIEHLVQNCVLRYRCPNACNLVLGRWECPIPVSRACNAACIGCISRQPAKSGVPSTQHRLDFTPTAGEIIEYVVPHLQHAPVPIASFGQGCEGEPLLQADLVEEAIRGIRSRTTRGSINLNTNASRPAAIERLCAAGLDSMRVSLNSVTPEFYTAYYRPKDYSFDDVVASIMIAKRRGVWVSINYLVFPGVTDSAREFGALRKFLRKTGIDMIQTRNLNIDPVWYADTLGPYGSLGKPAGIIQWINTVRKDFPKTLLGYFNPTPAVIRSRR